MQDGKYIINLFQGADASTVIHETGHFFVERMWQAILDGTASEQVSKDFDKLLAYGGMTREAWAKAYADGDIEARRQAHERITEGFETYIMENRAPSRELRNVFKRFSKWLTQVYATISRNKNAIPLTDEVSEVFDRMLVAQESIEQAERVNKYFEALPKVN